MIRDHAAGRASSVPVENIHIAVWTLSGGKVIRLQTFDDRGRALKAAGLSG